MKQSEALVTAFAKNLFQALSRHKVSLENRRSFRALLSAVFLDNVGLAVVYPIFTPLVLTPYYTLLPSHFPLSLRVLLLGVLIASFPFAQFLAGPLIGHLADRKGRKFALTAALFGETVGFFLTAVALMKMSYTMLIISRLFTGFFAGNLLLCLSAISDMEPEAKGRSKSFGIVAGVTGISFVIAIAIGGMLSNTELFAFFNSSLPFWALGAFSLINLSIIRIFFSESYAPISPECDSIKMQLKEIRSLFKSSSLGYLYVSFFFFMLGWIVSLQFLSTFLMEHFTKVKLSITLIFIGVGLTWCFGTIILNRLLIKRLKLKKILFYSLLLSCLTLYLVSEVRSLIAFVHLILIGALFASLTWANCLALISIKAPMKLQGKLLGVNQSIATISMAFAPLFGGLVGVLDIRTIYLFASTSLLISISSLIISKFKNCF